VSPTSDAASTSSPARGSRTPAPRAAGGKRRVVLDEELTIEGQLDKPNAFYVLSRAALDVDWARLDARFVPLVLESGQDPLF
jgi:hypothetical protein